MREPASETIRPGPVGVKTGRAQDVWPTVEPWYEAAKRGDEVVGGVAWAPVPGENDVFEAWGDLSAFTDEEAASRGLEGDLRNEPQSYMGGTPRNDLPFHLRIEKRGDQNATAEVTNGWGQPEKRRLLDYAFRQGKRTFSQIESDRDHWTTVQLAGSREDLGFPGPSG